MSRDLLMCRDSLAQSRHTVVIAQHNTHTKPLRISSQSERMTGKEGSDSTELVCRSSRAEFQSALYLDRSNSEGLDGSRPVEWGYSLMISRRQ